MLAMAAVVVGFFGFILFFAYLVGFAHSSRTDDLRCPSRGNEYETHHRIARKLAGTVVIRRD
jgi:hypothetical protein